MNNKRGGFKPLTDGLPQSVSVPQAMANIKMSEEIASSRRRGVSVASLRPSESPIGILSGDRMNKPQRDLQSRHESYAVGDTAPSKIDLRKDVPGPMLLKVTQIESYDKNPRIFGNEAREDIRQGLRVHGFTGTFAVTQRHPGGAWMLSAGSNTTLEVMKELWHETKDERFLHVNCVPQPYKGEATVLAQHLGENINRGDMRFWEIAKGLVDLLALVEVDRRRDDPNAKDLSAREAADEITANHGMRVTKTRIALYRFTVWVLESLGTAREALTMRAVRDTYQPRINGLLALAERFSFDEPRFLAEIIKPVLANAGAQYRPDEAVDGSEALNAEVICSTMEAAFAAKVGEPANDVARMLAILRLNPKASLSELRQPSPSMIAGGASSSPAAPTITAPLRQAQTPLNLGPGLVRTSGGHDNPPRTDAYTPPPATAQHASAPVGSPAPAPTAHGPLFSAEDAQSDPFKALQVTLEALLTTAGLQDTLRWHDPMPLGFFLDLPDREKHKSKTVVPGSSEDQARSVKTMVWWFLTTLACQWMDGIADCIDRSSSFFRVYSVEQAHQVNPLEGTDISSDAPDFTDFVFSRVVPGQVQEVVRQLRVVEELSAKVLEAMPERWKLIQRLIQSSKY